MKKNIITSLEEALLSAGFDCKVFFAQNLADYKKTEQIELFRYILSKKTDEKLLDYTIRHINSKKIKENLSDLIDFIIRPIEEKKSNLKVLAIKTISNFKDTGSVSALLYCLNNKNSNYKIKLASAEALGKIGDKNAFESLKGIVYDEDEKSVYVKESAVTALGMLGDDRALDVFDSIINTKQMFLEKFSYLKEKIIEAMAKFDISRDKKALEILKNSLLDNSPNVRISAIETIMNSEINNAYELIYDRLKFDDNIEVKKNALIALYNISDRSILDEVINGDWEKELKEQSREILEEYENE